MAVIRKSAILVVSVIDDHTGKMVSGSNIRVAVAGKKAYRKDDGYYVFINLSGSSHEITVESDIYLTETLHVDMKNIDSRNPVVYVRLKPNALHPATPGTTWIKGRLSRGGNLLKGASIGIEYLSGVDRIKISEDGVEAGSKAVRLYMPGDMLLFGKQFLINDKDDEGKSKNEVCRIAGAYGDKFLLEKGLQFGHKRGTSLIPIENTRTDEKGSFVILLKPFKGDTVNVALSFEYGGKRIKKKVTVKTGESLNMGEITFME